MSIDEARWSLDTCKGLENKSWDDLLKEYPHLTWDVEDHERALKHCQQDYENALQEAKLKYGQ